MLRLATMILACGIVLAPAIGATAADSMPGYVTAALKDTSRPEADQKRDADRKPGALVVYAGIKPGSKVAELLPGGGYYTRIFAKVVGAKGKVYAITPRINDALKALADDPAYSNVAVITGQVGDFKVPEPVDVVWTSQNYHDMHNMADGAVAEANKAAFAALKSGGVYLVTDHAAAAGSGGEATKTLHRIDPALVKTEVMAAGFKFEGEDNSLRNPADDHTAKVFEMHDKTDQFVYKFRETVIRKLKSGEYRLYSRKVDPRSGKRRNLGTFKSRTAALKLARRSEKWIPVFGEATRLQ